MDFIDSDTSPLQNAFLTQEGYLTADASAVRSGIQQYLGREVGKPALSVVNVYRPPEEVFNLDSVATFTHKPVTIDHPPGGVDAATWRDKAVGEISTDALRDGERLKLQLIIKDKDAVEQIRSGKRRQLSAGYTCDLEWQDGVAPDGTAYQAVQRNIRINHLALVERGRAGNCQIGDSAPWGITPLTDTSGAAPRQHKESVMDVKTLVLGDAAVKVVAEDEAKVTSYVAKVNADIAAAVADKDRLAGEVAALTQKLADAEMTPAKLQQLVADRAKVAAGYKALTGKEAPADLADKDIRRQAVAAKLGDSAKDMSDEGIAGAFAAFTAAPKSDPLAAGIQYKDAAAVDHAALFALAGVPMKKEG